MLRHHLVALAIVTALVPGLARGFDLAGARAQGAVLADALAAAERGDWARAAAIARSDGAPILSDIVLWRRLRAGEGSAAEYRAFTARRAGWPGRDALARAVFETMPTPRPEPPLTGRAARNWHAFDRAWDRRDHAHAARLLDQITVDRAGLGRPAEWGWRRRALVRREAREGDARLAYRLAARHHLAPADGYAYADLEWLAGWVALRKLGDPGTAVAHFERFASVVETPISLGRAGYWAGRAEAARGRTDEARRWFAVAARYQTSFYGQLAAAEIGAGGDARLAAPDLPDWRETPVAGDERARLATILHYAGERSLAWQSFVHAAEQSRSLEGFAGLGDLALALGLDNVAVRVAKIAARAGHVLPPAYYPLHPLGAYAAIVEPALALSVARQETELNPRAVSHAGARGLMQLMPGTAQRVAGWIGEPYDRRRLTTDWQYNARLGQTYLARRVAQFDGSYVLAAAAYNAGAHRVERWIAEIGDPRDAGVDVIDWIESIPFSETRNYVQRVIEGLYVYRTRLSGQAGPMTIHRDLGRGAGG